jgi:ribosomal protein S12 methylthiotransferase accessory factor YcaO
MIKDIKVRKLTWTESWAPGLHEYSAMLSYNGEDLYGHGTDFDSKIALTKAVAEVMERKTQRENKIKSSNGMAAHSTTNKAIEAAKNELIERHVYLSGHLNDHSIKPLTSFKLSENMQIFFENIKSHNLEVIINELGTFNNLHIVQVLTSDKNGNFGLSMGLGCEQDLNKAIEKAMIESFRRAVWAKESQHTSEMSLDRFKQLGHFSHADHRELALNVEYAKAYKEYLMKRYNNQSHNYSTECNFKLADLVNENSPFKFAKVSSPELQDVYLGPHKEEFIPHCLA